MKIFKLFSKKEKFPKEEKRNIFINGENNKIIFVNTKGERKEQEVQTYTELLSSIRINGRNNTVIFKDCIKHYSNLTVNGSNITAEFNKPSGFNLIINGFFFAKNKVIFGENFECRRAEMHLDECPEVIIGDNCLFSYGVTIWATDGHSILKDNKPVNSHADNKLEIGNNVWLGFNTTILPRTKIPSNTIVGACSVLTKNFNEENCIIAGSPARVIKRGYSWCKFNPEDKKNLSEYINKINNKIIDGGGEFYYTSFGNRLIA